MNVSIYVTPPPAAAPRDYLLWNWSDTTSLLARLHLLPLHLRLMLDDRRETISRFPHRFAREGQDCFGNSLILAFGEHSAASALCACTRYYGGRRCAKWQVCLHCAHRRERGVFDRFRSVVGSWSRCVSVTVYFDAQHDERVHADLPVLLEAWSQLHQAARSLVRPGALHGLHWAEDFLPVFHEGEQPAPWCWPHLHGLGFLAPGVKLEDLAMVAPAGMVVSFGAITSERHGKELLDYLVKVPPFAQAYREAWAATGAVEGGMVARDLNEVVVAVVGAFDDSGRGRVKTRSAGVLHHQHRGYLGASVAQRAVKGYAAATTAWLNEVNSALTS